MKWFLKRRSIAELFLARAIGKGRPVVAIFLYERIFIGYSHGNTGNTDSVLTSNVAVDRPQVQSAQRSCRFSPTLLLSEKDALENALQCTLLMVPSHYHCGRRQA